LQLNDLVEILEKQIGSTLDYPFGDDVMVYKVMGKMYALIGENDNPRRLNLKVDPIDAVAYRDIYENVIPGYHMNKKHWNTVYFDKDDSIPNEIIVDMIKDSYDLVRSKLTKKQKYELLALSK